MWQKTGTGPLIFDTLQEIFMTYECATTEFLAERKYGEISGKPLHFARYEYVLAVENMAKFSKNRHISDVINISCKVLLFYV